ncbi:TonB-dependent siderophore receptor [Burkholderia gladioli]|uniref:TonB-dependent siderophore receptor n=1 Tax=Burkholderia gladioli TaxID=28095 RepID=UPI00163EE0D1|nr:TonB-dependent siderophore receptor [Burkholderia gladioli]
MIARPSRRPATQPGAAAHPGHPRASRSRRGPVARRALCAAAALAWTLAPTSGAAEPARGAHAGTAGATAAERAAPDVAPDAPTPAGRRAWHVPAGELGAALSELASQAGVTIQMDARLVEGRRTRGIDGRYTLAEGFAALLAGSSLEAVDGGRQVWLVRARAGGGNADIDAAGASAAASHALPVVKVSSRAGDDDGGYVAATSSAGSKTATSLLEIPQSVSVVTHDQMVQQDAQTLNAAVRYTSGVQPETRGAVATRYDMLTVRGFLANTYWNGLKQVDNSMYSTPQIDPYLLERIDVLKGPVSVLYGQAAAGGVLDQGSKLPTRQPLHEIGVELGTDAHRQATFDFSGPLDADSRYLYRFTGIARSEFGQVESTRNERIALAPSFTWRPDEATSLTLYALYQRDPRSSSYGAVPLEGSVIGSPYGALPRDFYDGDTNFERFSRTEAALGYRFSRKLERDWTVRSNARYFHIGQDYASVYSSGFVPGTSSLQRYSIASQDQFNSIALDNQLEGRFATGAVRHTVLAGFDYQHFATSYARGDGSAPPLDVLAPNYAQPIDPLTLSPTRISGNQFGVYAQDQMRYGHFVLTLGARQDWANTSTATGGATTSQSARAFTKRAGLSYVFDNGIAPYVGYTESFSPQSGTNRAGQPFDPERAKQYEIGLKFQPTDYDAMFTIALFDLTRNNLLTTDTANPLYQTQSGEARSRGIELEAKASLSDSLNVTASYTYLDTKYVKDNSGLEGKFLTGVPQHQASAWAYYTQRRGPLAGLSAGAGLRYTGQTYNDTNQYRLASYLLLDATLRYDLGRLSSRLKGSDIYVNAQNLLNRRYVASCSSTAWCWFGYGRQVFAGANYRW